MPDCRPFARSVDDLRDLHVMCRRGRVYDVERWIAEGRPLQLASGTITKGKQPGTALRIAIESGQHSLTLLLLRSGYRHDLERYPPLDQSPLELALESRRWDLVELLLEWGADLASASPDTVLQTYRVDLYERFRAAGGDLTRKHALGDALGHSTSNRPLLGFAKRLCPEDPKIQKELNIALGYHARAGNEKGVNLCMWAGADPHAPTPNPEWGLDDDPEDEASDWSAIQYAASAGHLEVLKKLGPDPDRDDFESMYRSARSDSIIRFLLPLAAPKDMTAILHCHLYRFRWSVFEALFESGVQWSEADVEKLTDIRRSLLKLEDYELKRFLQHLKKPEVCATETYQELVRTPRMQERLIALGLMKKPVSEQEQLRNDVARLSYRYGREKLYKEVWSQPVQHVAKSYGVSDVALGKICRKLRVPVPPRGYWARVRSGAKPKRPPLPKLEASRRRPAAKANEGRSSVDVGTALLQRIHQPREYLLCRPSDNVAAETTLHDTPYRLRSWPRLHSSVRRSSGVTPSRLAFISRRNLRSSPTLPHRVIVQQPSADQLTSSRLPLPLSCESIHHTSPR